MRGCRFECPFRAGGEELVDGFERAEETDKRWLQVRRDTPGLAKVAMPELAGDRKHGSSHRTVFVRSPGPSQTLLLIDPQREAHTNRVNRPARRERRMIS